MNIRIRGAAAPIAAAVLFGCAPASPSASTSAARPVSHTEEVSQLDWSAPPAGKLFRLDPSPTTVVIGGYDPAAKPVLTIASGDEVDIGAVSTCSARLLVPQNADTGTVEPAIRAILATPRDQLQRGPGGHVLTGPIYVEGAEPGDVLEVRIKTVTIATALACNSTAGFLRGEYPNGSKLVPLDRTRMIGTFAPGIEIPLAPFFGSIGVAPPRDSGRVNSAPPSIHAGNLDNKELVAGTTLFIPVHIKGALLLAGDGHASQGNGEVDITALETALRGRFQIIVRKGKTLTWPRAETPTHWIAMGTHADLTTATKIAVREAVKLLVEWKGLTPTEAYQLISVACDVSVTQLVDGTMGMHVMIPKKIFTK
jgi:acetamidase/formamidase